MDEELSIEPAVFDDSWRPDANLAALVRGVVSMTGASPAFSICSTCGRRVDGTDKRKYCGRQCANRAVLIRRRQARSRLISHLRV